jgi:hypothetical protein
MAFEALGLAVQRIALDGEQTSIGSESSRNLGVTRHSVHEQLTDVPSLPCPTARFPPCA